MTETKRTPEELRRIRLNALQKARDTAASNRQKAAKPADAAAAKPAELPEFLGIGKQECCIGCTADKCVISGAPVCAHPCKGGLQPAFMTNAAAVERYNRARKLLAHVELDRRQD